MLVDEFQDLTPAHLLLIRLLSAPGGAVFGVGDDDQTIYGYAGASPAWLIDFADLFPGSGAHDLTTNYRCAPAVVAGARTLLGHNHRRIDKTIEPAAADPADDRGTLDVVESDDPSAATVDEVERLLEVGDVPSLNQAYALEPDNPDVLTALAGALIDEGQVDQGLALLDKIPETPATRHLRALARTGGESMDDIDATLAALLPTVKVDDDDRQKFVDLLEVLGPDDPRTAEWRRKLSTALF